MKQKISQKLYGSLVFCHAIFNFFPKINCWTGRNFFRCFLKNIFCAQQRFLSLFFFFYIFYPFQKSLTFQKIPIIHKKIRFFSILTCKFLIFFKEKFLYWPRIFPVFSRNFLCIKVYKQPEHLIFRISKPSLKKNNMSDETGIRDLSGYKSIIPPLPETQSTDDWFKNDNQLKISNSHPMPITTYETGISDMSDYKSINPPFPETQPTVGWIENEDQPKIESGPMSYTVPNSNLWSPLKHIRS